MKNYFGAPARRIVIGLAVSVALIAPAAALAPAAHAAGTVRSAISLTAPSAAYYGTKITLSGVLWRHQTSTKIAGAKVTLQRANRGKANWTSIASLNTSSTGGYAFTVTQGLAYDYRTYYAGNATYTAAVSPVRYPVVMQRAFLDEVQTINNETGVLRTWGRLSPATGARVYLQRYNPSTKAWVNIGSKVATSNYVSIDAKVGGSTGQYRFYAPMTYPYGAGYSAAKTFNHYVWRGLFKKPAIATGGTNNPEFIVDTTDASRYVADAFADELGTVWADVNLSGCIRLDLEFANWSTKEALGVKVISGTGSVAASSTISAAPGEEEPRTAYRRIQSPYPTLRLEFTDYGSTDIMDASVASRAQCAN